MKPPAIEVQFGCDNKTNTFSGGHGKWAVGGKGETSAYLGEGGSHSGKVILFFLFDLDKWSYYNNLDWSFNA